MKKNWKISNILNAEKYPGNEMPSKTGTFHFSYEQNCSIRNYQEHGIRILIDGFVLPRIDFFDQYSSLQQGDLVFRLFIEYGIEFIHKLKGNFNIIIEERNRLHIFNDHHSFKKYFIYQKDNSILITNQLNTIVTEVELELDNEIAALFSLTQHFVDGYTLFKNLNYSKPASHITISLTDNNVSYENYLSSDHFFTLERNKISLEKFSQYWRTLIAQYVSYLKPKEISMTITGGNDSRMILSAFIKNNIKVNLFSFGNPMSFDASIAKEISETVKLPYSNYFVKQPSMEWQKKYSEKILLFGNTMINIHRAHRLYAIENEIDKHPNVEMIFSGFMGGDYIKGLKYEDYITSRLIREIEFNPNQKSIELIIEELLAQNFINKEKINFIRLAKIVSNLTFLKEKERSYREFQILYHMIGSVHDMQDINVFASKVPYVINPFMDIDFMETFFASHHSPFDKKESRITQTLRLNRSLFHIAITQSLAPELSKIFYAKGGYYNASEYFGNKFILLLKRVYRYKLKKSQYVQNFSITDWMNDFCEEHLKKINNPVSDIYDIKAIQNLLMKKNKPTVEGFWHKFTNPINIDLNNTYFNRK